MGLHARPLGVLVSSSAPITTSTPTILFFGAQSRGPRPPCVRFASPVARHDATLGSGWWSAFPVRGSHPLGCTKDFDVYVISLLSKLGLAHDRQH